MADDKDKLEFKIIKDNEQQQVSLGAMSIEAANAFSILLGCMIGIIKEGDQDNQVSIQIKEGSAVLLAEGPAQKIETIYNDFDSVINNRSSNPKLVDDWKKVQKLFSRNGLEYDAKFYRNNQEIPIYIPLKNSGRISVKEVSYEIKTTLEFLKGKLIAVGGKHQPNIHVDIPGQGVIIIQCSEQNAKRANHYLYDTIRVSSWQETIIGKDKKAYTYCDAYSDNDLFEEFEAFIIRLRESDDQIASLKEIHYKCRFFLDKKDFTGLRKFMRLFYHKSVDINAIKTILVVTQSLREHDELMRSREVIKNLFDQKMAEYL